MAEQQDDWQELMKRWAESLEKANFGDYVQLLQNPRRMIMINFIGGLSRGVGIGVGFLLLAAVLVYVLQQLALLNLPVIGQFLAELVRIVQAQLHTPTI